MSIILRIFSSVQTLVIEHDLEHQEKILNMILSNKNKVFVTVLYRDTHTKKIHNINSYTQIYTCVLQIQGEGRNNSKGHLLHASYVK